MPELVRRDAEPFEHDPRYRFEGEADLFRAGDFFLLTHGRLERQRFVPALALPPWKRVYGFRTDARVVDPFARLLAPCEVVPLGLVLEAHYHGDTALCAFGAEREHLLVYRDAIDPADWPQLTQRFGDALIELDPADARRYAANSFAFASDGTSYLVMPDGLSQRLLDAVRERGTTPIAVDVSEFLKKGGGSVKCMIGDLGWLAGGALARPGAASYARPTLTNRAPWIDG